MGRLGKGSCVNTLMIHRCGGMPCKRSWNRQHIYEYMSTVVVCLSPMQYLFFHTLSYERHVFKTSAMLSVLKVPMTKLAEITSPQSQNLQGKLFDELLFLKKHFMLIK